MVEIVGVARASWAGIVRGSRADVHPPLWQDYEPAVAIHIRTSVDPARWHRCVRRPACADANLPVFAVKPLSQDLDAT